VRRCLREHVGERRVRIGRRDRVIAGLRDDMLQRAVRHGLRDHVIVRLRDRVRTWLRDDVIVWLRDRVIRRLRDRVRVRGDDVAGGRALFCSDTCVRGHGATRVRRYIGACVSGHGCPGVCADGRPSM
jgi:hypothetical protein